MLDRRLLAGIVAVAVVVLSARQALTSNEPADRPDTPTAATALGDVPTTVANSARANTPTATADPAPVPQPTLVTTSAPTADVSSPTTAVELIDLVEAARPTLPLGEIVDDRDAHHDHGVDHTDASTIASQVVVSAWTWRFDGADDDLADRLHGFATDAVIASLTSGDTERMRRVDAAEVAWVIVRDVEVDDDVVNVLFDHHVVTSTKAEAVTSRQALVTVAAEQAIRVVEVEG